ncbi:MAG TPA: PAS domain S-box protein [Luteibacter sp.]|nr:PAS domain S-box protein [Luteibacter sp.]
MAAADETRYELLVRSVVDYAICMLDTEGYIDSWNAGAESINGYTEEEILGQHFSVFYTEEDRLAERPAEALATARHEGRFNDETWRLRKDGTRFWALVVIDAIRDSQGQLIGFAKVTRDISRRHSAEQALLESERRFRMFVEGVTDYAIYLLDPEGCITDWNSGAQRIKGYRADEVLGRHLSLFYTPEDAAEGAPERALEVAARVGRYEVEGWRRRKDGSRFWASVVVDAIRDKEGELLGYAKITRDISDRREADANLAATREQLFHSQKLEALGQLTGGIAHDFNNLLQAMIGSLDLALLRLEHAEPGAAAELIHDAVESAHSAGALTRRLLAFARRQPLLLQVVDVNRLVASMEDMLARTMGENIQVRFDLAASLPVVRSDPSQLESALLNLALNARDAMPQGGTLTIATSRGSVGASAQQPDGLSPGWYVRLRISDTGIGMAADVIARAFDPFFTTKPLGQGTGLGLSMIHGFARQSGGMVHIDSKPGVGSVVELFLPETDGADDMARGDGSEEAIGDSGIDAILLVVEDDPAVRMIVAAHLGDLGYSVLEASTGPEGLDLLESQRRIDLVVADVGLPGLNGRQMIEAARRVRPALKVLFVTGYADMTAHGNAGVLASGTDMLAKPFELGALAAKVEALLAVATPDDGGRLVL